MNNYWFFFYLPFWLGELFLEFFRSGKRDKPHPQRWGPSTGSHGYQRDPGGTQTPEEKRLLQWLDSVCLCLLHFFFSFHSTIFDSSLLVKWQYSTINTSYLLLITVNMTPRFPKYIEKKRHKAIILCFYFKLVTSFPLECVGYIQMFYTHQIYLLGIMMIRKTSFLCFSDLHLVNVQNQLSNLLYNNCCFTILLLLFLRSI